MDGLTIMLLAANFANTKSCKRTEKCLKPWQMGTHLRVLSESYLMNANMAGFRWFSKSFVLVLWTKVAMEGFCRHPACMKWPDYCVR